MGRQELAEARPPSSARRLELRVPAVPGSVQGVRHAVGALGMPPSLADDARLLVSELLTNSIRHAGLAPDDRVRVRAEWSGSRLRVDVWDRAQTHDPPQLAGAIRPAPGSESGWGLYLVDQLASRWGLAPGRFWFEIEDDDRLGLAGR